MKERISLALLASLYAGNAAASNLDDKINEVIAPIVNPFVGMIFSTIPFPLPTYRCLGLFYGWSLQRHFFTFYLEFINVRGFKHAVQLVSGKFSDPKAKEDGGISFPSTHHSPFWHSGTWKYRRVAVAVSIGGAATFWMILGLPSGYVE